MSVECEYEIVWELEPEGGLPGSSGTKTLTSQPRARRSREAIEMAKEAIEVTHEDGLPTPTVHRSRVAVHAA